MTRKVLVASLGSIGLRHLRNTRELLPDSEIAVFRQHNKNNTDVPEGADKVFVELEDALSFKPDAVIIASPASEHIKNSLDFLGNGAHLFIEKPLAVTHSEVKELVAVTKNTNLFTMVGYVLRFQPIVGFLKNLINSGEIGEVRTANIEVGQYLPDWRPDGDYRKGVSAQKKLGGGALLELSHELDYSTWFFGDPDTIFCSSHKVSDLDIDVEDSACVVMEYKTEKAVKRVLVQMDFLQRTAHMSVKVVGSEGTLDADLIKETAKITLPENETVEVDVPKLEFGNEMYLRQFDLFFNKSFEDYTPRFKETEDYDGWVSVERAARVLELVDKSKQSNAEGKRLDF